MASALGWLAAVTSVLFFGSNFTVIAKYETGDGMFFQLVLCLGIWCTGLAVLVFRHFVLQAQMGLGAGPAFYPVVMAGGAFWCTGNIGTVFVVNTIGLGPGLVLWGSSSMIVGWLTGFFGLFDLPSERDTLRYTWLNILGFALACVALVISTLVKKGEPLSRTACADAPSQLLNDHSNPPHGEPSAAARGEPNKEVSNTRRAVAILACICMGFLYGVNFAPSTWISKHPNRYHPAASTDSLDYVFNQFCGILVTSIFYFLVYCAYMKNQPKIYPQVCLPGFISGAMWAIAQTGWFVANGDLGYSTAFPLINIGPGFVGSLWSIFLFKDVYGMKNYKILASYFIVAAMACGCIVLSKKPS